MGDENLGIVGKLANYLDSDVDALTLLISLFAGYPLALIHRNTLHGKSPILQHLYFIVCGLSLCYFNFGVSTIHSIVGIVVNYVLLLVIGGTTVSVVVSFAFNMVYLCVGYYTTMTDSYAVTWTTSHCVLVLRLIGLAYDLYDGKKKPESLSEEQKETALSKLPSLLEVAAHTYFYGGFLVGPQFPMRRYQSFVRGDFADSVSGGKPASVTPALKVLVAGVFYTALYQVTTMYVPTSFMSSPQFGELSWLSRCLYVTIWGKFALNKYLACWLITEGSCILTGLTYNGKDENGNDLWNGCANIKIWHFESGATLKQLVEAFNINTNRWMARYVYKRLKFVGSKLVSTAATMFMLAIWHGLCSGYFMCFFLELIMMRCEAQMGWVLGQSRAFRWLMSWKPLRLVFWVVTKVLSQFALSYALVPFSLFSYDKYLPVYMNLYFIGLVFPFLWALAYPTLQRQFREPRVQQQNGLKPSEKTE